MMEVIYEFIRNHAVIYAFIWGMIVSPIYKESIKVKCIMLIAIIMIALYAIAMF